ncbi:unnamed protein product [Calypogeia fissa]
MEELVITLLKASSMAMSSIKDKGLKTFMHCASEKILLEQATKSISICELAVLENIFHDPSTIWMVALLFIQVIRADWNIVGRHNGMGPFLLSFCLYASDTGWRKDGDVVSKILLFDDATLEEILVSDFGVALEEIATSSFQQVSTNTMSVVAPSLEEDWHVAWVESLLSGDEPFAYDIHEAYLIELNDYHWAAHKGWQSVQCYRELVASIEEKIAIN